MKKLPKALLVAGMVFAVMAMLWVVLLPTVVAMTIRTRTGFAVKVDRLSVNPFTAHVVIKGLVLKNPEGWPVADFVDLRDFRAEISLLSLLGDRWEAKEVLVDVARLTVVRNQQNTLNAVAFSDAWSGPAPASPKPAGTKPQFLIRHLSLKFDKLVYADYSGGKPSTKEYDLNIRRDLREVDSVTKIISPFTGSALTLFTDVLRGSFKRNPTVLNELTGGLMDAGKKTGEVIKGLIDSLEKKKP